MNYKSIISSRKLRLRILNALSWVPDEFMVKLQYKIHTGRTLNLKSPKRFTEKIQLYKLNYRDSRLWRCVDKYEVHEYLRGRGLDIYLNDIYGVYDNVNEIDFTKLPSKFVVKATSGGGSNFVDICYENNAESQERIIKKFKGIGGKKEKKPIAREWAYHNMPPTRIIVEKLIEDKSNPDTALTDYKFYCFSGKPYYCQVIADRTTKETIDFYDMDWNHQPFYGLNRECKQSIKKQEKPENWHKMVSLAEKLAEDFPFVRVDLYNIEGKIIFGELTFYPASGYGAFTPDEYDFVLGDLLDIKEFTPNT